MAHWPVERTTNFSLKPKKKNVYYSKTNVKMFSKFQKKKESWQPSFFSTHVHLYKVGSVFIKYEPFSFIPCNMDSVARLPALRH